MARQRGTVGGYADAATASTRVAALRRAHASCPSRDFGSGMTGEYRLRESASDHLIVEDAEIDSSGVELIRSFTVASVSGSHLVVVSYSVGEDFTPDTTVPDRLLEAQEAGLNG
ncbi:MAG: hypothetical protein H0T14_05890 [Nocardioidaceae bacterium]|nr:hypothetical protein [Nocardioidaceae bacterium]